MVQEGGKRPYQRGKYYQDGSSAHRNNHFEEPKGYRIYDKLAAAGKKIEGYFWELEENGAYPEIKAGKGRSLRYAIA